MADPAEIVKVVLVADVNPVEEAVSAFDPTLSILRFENVARPVASVSCVTVPDKMPVPEESVILTVSPDIGTLLPEASFNWTVTAGVMAAPAVALVGSCTNTRWVADPAEIVKVVLVADVNPVEEAISVFDPTVSMLRFENVASPVASVSCVTVPDKIPVPEESAILTVSLIIGTLLPNASFN